MDFIKRMHDLAKSSSCIDGITYYHFDNALRGTARKWLFPMDKMCNFFKMNLFKVALSDNVWGGTGRNDY
jgi:hypothetical protein